MDLSWNLSDASQISSINDVLLGSIDSNDGPNILTESSLINNDANYDIDEIPEVRHDYN